MARDAAYRKAEKRIEAALESGATKLDLNNFGLTELPESLGRLTQLLELCLNDNKLTSLPDGLSHLTQLQTLQLFSNKLKRFPHALRTLTALRTCLKSLNSVV